MEVAKKQIRQIITEYKSTSYDANWLEKSLFH